MTDPKTVALVFDGKDGTLYDECWTWEAAQTYALYGGYLVIAVEDDGHMSVEDIQNLCDSEAARYADCFG